MTERLLLPFSMGRQYLSTYSYIDVEYDHPILNIGSSYSSIKPPILEWLAENYGDKVHTGFDGDEYYIDFPTKADITLFLLRWSHD